MIVIIMGVSGSGKSTLLAALTARLGWRGLEADELHSAANVSKMTRGIPLDDTDRRLGGGPAIGCAPPIRTA